MRNKTLTILLITFATCTPRRGVPESAEPEFKPSTLRVVDEKIPGLAEPVNEILYNHSRNGLNIRSSVTTSSPKIGILPYKAKIQAIEKWENRQLIDSESLWYHIKFGKIDGWISGLYLTPWPPETDYSHFKGGCLYGQCGMCPTLHFQPDQIFKMSIGCHYGWGEGKWWTQPDGIHADVTLVATCYDFCVEAAKSKKPITYEAAKMQFELAHTHTVHLRFFQTENGIIDFEASRPSRPDLLEDDLPKRPLGRMIPYKVPQ